MKTIFWILLSTFLISLISLIGIITLIIKDKFLKKILMFLVSLSAGALMGGAFLHLIPESLENFSSNLIFIYVLLGFIVFFLIEKIFHWRHCHDGKCPIHTFAYINLLGDSVHNFIDGLIIAAAFIFNTQLGIITTLAVALHEIPQEIGGFGVLIYGGFKKIKALLFNFITALTAILGGIIGYFLSSYIENSLIYLLPFAAGGFIYIAASDLIPEIRKELNIKKSLLNFAIFIIGILIMYIFTII
ncbi:MAG: ZIP family metal transporter [Nanoarchaeota archaeon]|nr:ZIP family metal transporter [Nanoarchaeota archaeon]